MNDKKSIVMLMLLLLLLVIGSGCTAITDRLLAGTQIAEGNTLYVFDGEQADESISLATDSPNDLLAMPSNTPEINQAATEASLATATENSVLQTQIAQLTEVAILQEAAAATATAEALLPTATSVFTSTPTPTQLPSATPSPTATEVPCLAAKFISDISIPDGSIVAPGADFFKTWRLQNVGTCIWRPDFKILFIGGEPFGVQQAVRINTNVYPGLYVDLTLQLKAPTRNGIYRGDFMLVDLEDTVFGVGETQSQAFYVIIKVVTGDD